MKGETMSENRPDGYNQHVVDQIQWERIHEPLRGALQRYIEHGVLFGDFLYAMLTNNLTMTFQKADSENVKKVQEILTFIYQELPGPCWGSEERVESWVKGFQ
jgi:hypothetical protein